MVTRDTQHPALELILCDRSAQDRKLVHIACCGSNEEHATAMRQFLRRAQLQSVATPTSEPHGVDVP